MAESRHTPNLIPDSYLIPIIRLPIIMDPKDLHPNGKLLSEEQIARVATATNVFHNTKISKRLLPHQANTYSIIKLQGKLLAVYLGAKHGRLLGRGTFGKIKLAQDCQTGEFYALKIQPAFLYEVLRKEIKFQLTVGLLAESENAEDLCFTHYYSTKKNQHLLIGLMRYVYGSPMETQRLPISTPPILALSAIIQVAQKLCYLHTQLGIIHRDLHSWNVLFDYLTNSVTIIDYGLAMDLNGKQVVISDGFKVSPTSMHVPPEARNPTIQCAYSAKTDAYAFGKLLKEWLRVRLCLPLTMETNPRECSPFISQIPCAQALQTLIHELLATNPDNRPSLENAALRLMQILEAEKAQSATNYTCAIVPVSYYLNGKPELRYSILKSLRHFHKVILIDDQVRNPVIYSAIYRECEKYRIYVHPEFILSKNGLFQGIKHSIERLVTDYHSYDFIYCLNQDGTFWPASQVMPELDASLAAQAIVNLSNNRHSLFSTNTIYQAQPATSTEPTSTALLQRHG